MSKGLLIIAGVILIVAGLGAATLIRISQIQGGPTGTFVLTSVNGTNSWTAPSQSNPINFSDAEVPSGTINGTTVAFTLAHPPVSGSVPIVTVNGIVQRPTIDFTLTGSTITFAAASTPQTGDLLQVWYRF